ncbi:MAG: hypothetical protein ACYDHZ_10800 [Dehalococcoidia bacterium]
METQIETAIKLLAEKITKDVKSDDALKYTQAALNLAHTAQVVAQAAKTVKQASVRPG